MPSTTEVQLPLDPHNLPTSILVELYTVAVDGVVTEMHTAMQARHENIRRTGRRRLAVPYYEDRDASLDHIIGPSIAASDGVRRAQYPAKHRMEVSDADD